ncbi:MAG: ATP-binding protein [Thermoanaerobaculia bacterium]
MHSSQRIAFVGAHGTGKTTLARAVAEKLQEAGIAAPVVPEVPRWICSKANDPVFFRREKNSPLRQVLLLLGQPVFETALLQSRSAWLLCDRSLLDHWAYTRLLFRDELLREGVTELLDEFVSSYTRTYDYMFYVPIEFAPLDDGTREGDDRFQEQVDSEIRQLLGAYRLATQTVSGTVEARVATVISQLLPSVLLR